MKVEKTQHDAKMQLKCFFFVVFKVIKRRDLQNAISTR